MNPPLQTTGALSIKNSAQSLNRENSGLDASSHPRASETSLGPRAVIPPENTSDWTSIDLGGMMISNLSRAIFAYEFLTCLYLNHNNLRTLSTEISRLKNLSILNLTGNKLTVLPTELGLVVSLKELLLIDNQISYLPTELGQLYRLETLGLEGNPMTDPIASMILKEGTSAVITYLRDICPGTST
jgi:CCR4-NOT transcription complex subunit 6